MLKRALYGIGSVALGLLLLYGCQPDGRPDLSSQIRVTNAEVRDYTHPDDGKTYLVVAPTWKNEGPEAVREVWLSATLKGSGGEYDFEGEPKDSKAMPWVHYSGDPVDSGSSISPSEAPETFAVMGLKEAVLAKTGPNPEAKVEVMGAYAELRTEEPPGQGKP